MKPVPSKQPDTQLFGGEAGKRLHAGIHALRALPGDPLLMFSRAVNDSSRTIDQRKAGDALAVIDRVLDSKPPKVTFTRKEIDALACLPDSLSGKDGEWAYATAMRAAFQAHLNGPLEEILPFHEGRFKRVVEKFWADHGTNIHLWTENFAPADVPWLLKGSSKMDDAMEEYFQSHRNVEELLDPRMGNQPPLHDFHQALRSALTYFQEKERVATAQGDFDISIPANVFEAEQALNDYERDVLPLVKPSIAFWNGTRR